MGAEELKLSEHIEAEFNPLVIIVAEHPDRYSPFAQTFVKNGFQCEVHASLPAEMLDNPKPGSIYFISFNLKSSDPTLVVRALEEKQNACIVFAEQEGFDTAAKLSSAKMSQTLQHPYTAKNFLMAVQTIVKKRRVQHEKDLRKQTVLDRRKEHAEAPAAPNGTSGTKIFKHESSAVRVKQPVIIQHGVHAKGPGTAFFKGAGLGAGFSQLEPGKKHALLSEMQKGLKSAKFMVMPSSAPSTSHQILTHTETKTGAAYIPNHAKEPHAEPTRFQRKVAEKISKAVASSEIGKAIEEFAPLIPGPQHEPETQTERTLPEASSAAAAVPSEPVVAEPKVEVTKIVGDLAVPTWVLIAVSSIGILFCLFFLYEMLFHRL